MLPLIQLIWIVLPKRWGNYIFNARIAELMNGLMMWVRLCCNKIRLILPKSIALIAIDEEFFILIRVLRVRAAKMLTRAKKVGLKSLDLHYPDLKDHLQGKGVKQAIKIKKQDAGLVYWSMTAWAGAISLSKDSPDVVADLPEVLRLAEMAWQANPQFDHGALASMMGTLELAKPGGKPEAAEKYFNLAIEWRGTQVAPLISKAENWAVATQNKEAFQLLLNQAIELAGSQNDLSNAVMRRRAQWLLDSTDNLF